MIGVIFSNIFDSELGDLTKNRTLASLPFGARYRLIDFILSNMSNSKIDNIAVITKYNYQSLMDHLGSCEEWDLNRKNGYVVIIPPFSNGPSSIYKGKLEALYGALMFLKRAKANHVLISSSNVICNIDYEDALKSHIESGYKVTSICYKEKSGFRDKKEELVLSVHDNKVNDIMINHTYTEDNYIGMGMYIVEKSFLINVVEECVSHGLYDFEKDFLQQYFLNKNLSINLFEFKNSVLRIEDVPSYFSCNMELLNEDVRKDIFNPQTPIYTKVRDEIPTYYDKNCDVNDSLIADGCKIMGCVENSIIFRDVTIEKGVTVKNSVIMQGCLIKENSNIDCCITDKDCVISENSVLIGNKVCPLIIKKGQII